MLLDLWRLHFNADFKDNTAIEISIACSNELSVAPTGHRRLKVIRCCEISYSVRSAIRPFLFRQGLGCFSPSAFVASGSCPTPRLCATSVCLRAVTFAYNTANVTAICLGFRTVQECAAYSSIVPIVCRGEADFVHGAEASDP